ncbi:hypothetical protein HDU98_004296 [Podochytrium sp. JEL0797]|nr:hypothetical protein HDU98_004296 [Podochytrium sp. JEL0797]
MISARHDSKAKMLRFFGESGIPVQSGSGSNSKLSKFLLGVPTSRTLIQQTLQTDSELEDVLEGDVVDDAQRSILSSGHTYTRGGNSIKLCHLLGPDAEIATAVKEIAGQTNLHDALLLLLESKLPVCYFLLFLIQQGKGFVELFFVSDVLAFEQTPFDTTQAQIAESQRLFRKYSFTANGKSTKLACPPGVVRRVIMGIQNGVRACFAPIQSRAFCDLTFLFAKFKQSPLWSKMEREIAISLSVKNLLSLAIMESEDLERIAHLEGLDELAVKQDVIKQAMEFVVARVQCKQ